MVSVHYSLGSSLLWLLTQPTVGTLGLVQSTGAVGALAVNSSEIIGGSNGASVLAPSLASAGMEGANSKSQASSSKSHWVRN